MTAFFIIFHKGYSWGGLSRHIVWVDLKMISFVFLKAGYSLRHQIKATSAFSHILQHVFSCFQRRTADDNFILHLLMYLLTVYMLLFSTLKQLLMHFWVVGITANSLRMRSSQADCHVSGLCQHFLDGDRIVLTTTQQIPNLSRAFSVMTWNTLTLPFAL